MIVWHRLGGGCALPEQQQSPASDLGVVVASVEDFGEDFFLPREAIAAAHRSKYTSAAKSALPSGRKRVA